MTIVGVSFDSPSANQAWAEEEGYTFDLWTDDDKTLALYYGAARNESTSIPDRITRLLGADGAVLLEYDDVNYSTSPQDVLEDCQALFGGQ